MSGSTMSTARTPPAWHLECRRLRAAGKGFADIAKAIGKSESVVRHCLNENGEQERKRDRDNQYRRDERAEGHVKAVTLREPRKILVDPETKQRAVEAFAAGKISRATMIQRITAGKPDTSAELAQRAGAI